MRKIFNWVLAATLVCGASVFTSCTSDTEDNPAQEQAKKNRKEFIEHTRANLKDVAENLNFSTWKSVGTLNTYFNRYVLNNPEFEQLLGGIFRQRLAQSIVPLSEEEAAQTGKKLRITIDLASFNITFTNTETGMVAAENDGEGLVFELSDQASAEKTIKIALKGGGEVFEQHSEDLGNPEMDVLIRYPKRHDLVFSTKQNGQWVTCLVASTETTIGNGETEVAGDATNLLLGAFSMKGTITTSIPGDDTEMLFDISQNPGEHKGGLTFDLTHNSRKLVSIAAELNNVSDQADLSQLTSGGGTTSILEVLSAIIAGNCTADMKLTLIDDLTTTMKVEKSGEVMELITAMSDARRNYADQQTIEGYVSALDKLITTTMTCKGVNQNIPMKLVTTKVGVDYWAMPALNFADENGYVPLTDLLDKESMEYGANIIDHAVLPLKESIVVMRQLTQALQKLQSIFYMPAEEQQ
ncbi:MAG: hypothetical protein II822_03790 [Prevotella sp.]|nr:hypothetical protein [Prevotella sp.]